jgi:hypothetical protein
MTVTPAVIARLKKILALAEGGTGGEKDNAAKMLDAALKKYNLTLDDLGVDSVESYEFHFKNDQERDLLMQVIAKVTNKTQISFTKIRRNRTSLFFKLTAAKAIEAEFIYNQVKQAWKSEVDRMFLAFIYKNGLTAEPAEGDKKENPMSEEELEAIMKMMDTLRKVDLKKGIEHKK